MQAEVHMMRHPGTLTPVVQRRIAELYGEAEQLRAGAQAPASQRMGLWRNAVERLYGVARARRPRPAQPAALTPNAVADPSR